MKNLNFFTQYTRNFKRQEDESSRNYSRSILLIFTLVVIMIICGGVFSFILQQNQQQNSVQNDLKTIAQLKVEQISTWRNERLANANFMMESFFYAEGVEEWLKSPTPYLETKIKSRLNVLNNSYPYKDVILTDTNGKVLLSLNQTSLIDPQTLALLPQAFQFHQSILVDFHRSDINEQPHIDIIAPMFVRDTGTERQVAAVVLSIDPRQYLYPLIESWPLPNRTAETLLVCKDGDDALFLNNVKFSANSALSMRIPLIESEVPAVQAVLGREGLFRGTDYRGEKVISVLQPIPNTPWYLVAKIDISEAFSQVRFTSVLILGLTIVTSIIALLFAVYYIQRRRSLTFELLYKTQIERQAIQKHYEYLVKFANDMIFLITEDLHIIEANDRALEAYGYTRDELPSLIIDDLVEPNHLLAHRQKIKELAAGGHNLYQSIHQLKNGTTFPVEVSAVNIKVEGQTYLQWIIRDITERKIAEQMLITAKNELEIKVVERTSELARANAQLRDFAIRMVRIQEDEKKRIACDLHDQIGQSLTALKLMINQAVRMTNEQGNQTLTEAQQVLSELMSQVREMSLNLRPSMLDDLGLLPALTWHLDKYQTQTKIKVIFNHQGLKRKFSSLIAETAYRVIQEALTNAAKYAGVTEVQIGAWADDSTLTLRVEDSGIGFEQGKLASNVSFGLRGMSERLFAVRGTLQIVSEPGSGTVLTAVIPLDEENY